MPGPYREVQDLYFHAGQDFVLNTRDVIGVFDLDTDKSPSFDHISCFNKKLNNLNKIMSWTIDTI